MELLLSLLIESIILGAKIALVAAGYALVYTELKMINFAFGEFVTFGAYVLIISVNMFGLPYMLAVPMAIFLTAMLGWIVVKFAYRPILNADRLMLLLASIAVSMILQNIFIVFFGADEHTLVDAPYFRLLPVVPLIPIAGVLYWIIRWTKFGLKIRAIAQSPQLARIQGVNSQKTITTVFLIASGLAGIAGVVIGLERGATPIAGFNLGIAAFISSVIGGLDSVTKAVAASFLVGAILSYSVLIPSIPSDGILFMILMVGLLIRKGSYHYVS